MTRTLPVASFVLGLALGADPFIAQAAPGSSSDTRQAEGLIMVDYEVVPVPGSASIDLMGFHFLNKMNDWLYLGIGGYAPLFKGEYGGFMALDVTGHVQRRLFGRVFGNAGLSVGGGGGGKSVQQSIVLSGTGGFYKAYVGLGYEFEHFSVGANLAKIKFAKSAIEHSQLNVFAQVPFSYTAASYAAAGERASPQAVADAGRNVMTLGFDNYRQINPTGSNKGTIRVVDLQFSRFWTDSSYWFVNAAVGYKGMPLYNQVLGGVGYRWALSPQWNLSGQLGVGSGGYAPEKIDTGPGLLVFPKLTAEYQLDRNFGLALSAGYLAAPKGTSKNYTLGASLNYHLNSGQGAAGDAGGADWPVYKGYRINLFQQTEFNVTDQDVRRGSINMVTAQLDSSIGEHLYIPVQVSVAYNAYLGYPGYGEILGGIGVQNRYAKDQRFQFFGQLLAGTNSHGLIFKTGAGVTVGVSDQLALYGVAGQTFAPRSGEFRSDYVGLGLSYRFSVAGR